MAAPSSTVPVPTAATGSDSTNAEVDLWKYVQEVMSGTATLLQEVPAEVLPFVGIMCKTFLALEHLVETAKSNKEALYTLRKLCFVVIKGLLARTGHPWLPREGFEELQKHVERVEKVALLCNGRSLKRRLLARKISSDIATIRSDVLAFCSVNNLVLADSTDAKIDRLAADFDSKLYVMEQRTITQAEYEAMEKELEKELEAKDVLEAELRSSKEGSAAREAELEAALVDSKDTLAAMKAELGTLAAMKTEIEEQRTVAALASGVNVSPGAPRIRDWFVERKVIVDQACDRLGVGSKAPDTSSEEPRTVGLAGRSGAGKSTVASMVVAREDVRATFHRGILWLQVGPGAKDHLAELMNRLAGMVYETVMRKACRPPPKIGIADEEVVGSGPEHAAAYIREVVDESSRRFLVVVDDVWDVEVLEVLGKAGLWILCTTRDGNLLPEASPLRLDQVLKEEAELVLRRAAHLDDDARLPQPAYELMSRSEFVVLDLAFMGRWGDVRGRSDDRAWQRVLNRILEAQHKGEGEGTERLAWRVAVLRAGLKELAGDNPNNRELYLLLAVIPKGVSFPAEVAAVLLYGVFSSAGDHEADHEADLEADLEAAKGVLETLERWSILTLKDGDRYHVHDQHADFILERFISSQEIRKTALPRWRGYISSARALLKFRPYSLVMIWHFFRFIAGEGIPSRPYDMALNTMGPSNTDFPTALETAAEFHVGLEDWLEAGVKFSRLLVFQEDLPGGKNSLNVANTLHRLGACAYKARRTVESEKLQRRALTILEQQKLDVDHLDLLPAVLNMLGLCAHRMGRNEEAANRLRQALSILEKVDSYCFYHVVEHNLAGCELLAGRIGEAERRCRRVLAVREEMLGAHHTAVANTLNELGQCAFDAGRTEEAEEHHRRALSIREKRLGVDHPDVALTLHNLGMNACRAGNMESAEKLFRRSLTIRKKQGLGHDHPDVKQTRRGLRMVAPGKRGKSRRPRRFTVTVR